MKKRIMNKYMNESKKQQFAEQALSVVMAKWGTEAIAERNALGNGDGLERVNERVEGV